MADEKTILQYKGHPLMRKDNMIYYGSMADSHIVMLQILETKKVKDTDIATKVSVELQLTDPNARAKDRIVKKSEKDGFFTALDLGSVWPARWPQKNNSPSRIAEQEAAHNMGATSFSFFHSSWPQWFFRCGSFFACTRNF